MSDTLNQVDLAFVVDTTGSMGAFIGTARQRMAALLEGLTARAATPIDLRVGVVEYRDHPPQDQSFVARVHGFDRGPAAAQRVIAALQPNGGGDGPEAVFDGVKAACDQLDWRRHSRRLAVLVGDAPPHGCGAAGDGFRNGCPCGLTTESTTALAEERGVTLYALGLTRAVKDSFGRLASWTGGDYFDAGQGNEALEALKGLLAREFEDVDFDRRVLEVVRADGGWGVDGVSEALSAGRGQVAASVARLGRRGFLS